MRFLRDPEKKSLHFGGLSEGGNRQIHWRELCVKEVSKLIIANDVVGNIAGNDRPLIEQTIGQRSGNLHLQKTRPDRS